MGITSAPHTLTSYDEAEFMNLKAFFKQKKIDVAVMIRNPILFLFVFILFFNYSDIQYFISFKG